MSQESSATVLHGQAINHSSLLSTEGATVTTSELSMKNFICGIANFPDETTVTSGTGIRRCGFQGNNCSTWQTFAFTFDAGVEVTRSAVSLSLLGISNNKSAENINYTFRNITSSQNGSMVTVTGEVLIGDTDGYLFQLGYTCIVA
ncbi:hypothetical protein [Dickeya oryzae]|uniref:hypothetical protein n=1 Tax=Dickeya oryzae TaxID=1240404 RepID=UPI001AED01FA|nr:hypothetical protein [Dickeya oryzae]MBP2847805.1 hypothetical protein [Dickeya oryzae]